MKHTLGLEIPLIYCCRAPSWLAIWPLEHSHCGIRAAKEMSGCTGIDQCTDDNCSLVEVFEGYIEAVQTAGRWFRAFSRRMIEL